MTDATHIADAILETTKQMVALAEQGDISAFRQTQQQRDALIQQLEAVPLEVEAPDSVRDTLIEAQQLNDQLRQALSDQERALLDRKSEIKRGQRMQQAYGNNK